MSNIDTQAELFAALQTLAATIPQMRSSQLIAVVGELCTDLHGRGLWDASDEEMLEAVWKFHRDFMASRAPSNSHQAEPVTAKE